MKIIYGGELIYDNYSHYSPDNKTGLSVWVSSGTVTIEGSDDNFITTPFSQSYVTDTYETINETYNYWRMVGNGKFFIGTEVIVDDPDHPYSFKTSVDAVDKFTLGGTPTSKIHNARRMGSFNWQGIKEANLAPFEEWFNGSGFYRDIFCAEDRIKEVMIPCTSIDDFPFQLDVYDIYSGNLELIESL